LKTSQAKIRSDSDISAARELDVLILGPVPPPLGGIAAHVSRLVPHLQRAGLTVGVLNHFGSTDASWVLRPLNRNPLNYYRLPRRFPARVVHYHHSHWATLLAVALGKGRTSSRYVLTLHGNDVPQRLKSGIPLLRHAVRWAIRRFDAIIVVNPEIRAAIQDHVGACPIEVLPDFLEARDQHQSYESPIEEFLASGRTVLVPAFRVQLLRDRSDLYGLDLAVEAFLAIAAEQPNLRLALFIAERPTARRAARYLRTLVRRLEEADLEDRVLILFGLPLTPAFRHDVILVRPTRTDGDAVSVREALHAGVPVLASDVVGRPPGVVTFATEVVADLRRALRQVVDGTASAREPDPRAANDGAIASDFVASFLRIYRAQIDSSRSETSS
jgi:glycosyltransferase involved in cell wall biosynthesis